MIFDFLVNILNEIYYLAIISTEHLKDIFYLNNTVMLPNPRSSIILVTISFGMTFYLFIVVERNIHNIQIY